MKHAHGLTVSHPPPRLPVRIILAQPDPAHVHEQFEVTAAMLGWQAPMVEAMLRAAQEELHAFTGFPRAHWRQIWSTHPLERVHKEIKRRTDVVGVFPKPEALLRLGDAVLTEQHDEWVAADRRYFSEASVATLTSDVNSLVTDIPLDVPPSPRHDHLTDLSARANSHHSEERHPKAAPLCQ